MSEFISPRNLASSLEARAKHPEYVPIAGGTDHMVASKDRGAPAGMINLFGLSELSEVSELEGGGLRIGACVTYARVLDDERVASRFPVLSSACREVGASQIQARGTLGGNIATSSPVGDSLPALLALGATICVASVDGERRIPYEEFLLGYRKVDLAGNELIVAIEVPVQHKGAVQTWRKVGTRRAQSISKLTMAAVAHLDDGKIAGIRIALGAVADRTVRAKAAEAALLGQSPNDESATRAIKALAGEIVPIDDVRSNADYRLGVAQNLVRRFVLSL
ncbi:MAG: xanthine dehydrogenase family protein subunit M [Myxococcales bacterium]|nr:xanthine dehydrogenase family protein subunit M [Myxococcales bacterium]